jgi:hypothetical protein
MKKTGLLLMLGALCAQPLWAAPRNDLPSCYDQLSIADKPASSGRELVMVIDETTQLTLELKKQALGHLLRFVQAGDSIKLYRFSAYLPDSHMTLEFAGQLDAGLTQQQRDSTGQTSLRRLDKCMLAQQKHFQTSIAKRLAKSFGSEDKKIAKSEIFFSLKQISQDWQHSAAEHKVLFLVSDMLENSDFASFYQNNQLKNLQPAQEIAKVEQQQLLPDFTAVRVYVLAAGLVPNEVKHGYRSGKTMQSLQTFWQQYFAKAGASLEGFGTPSLTTDLK